MGDELATAFTVGVEEEYQIVDAETFALRPRAGRILPQARRALGSEVQPELVESQIEIDTCTWGCPTPSCASVCSTACACGCPCSSR